MEVETLNNLSRISGDYFAGIGCPGRLVIRAQPELTPQPTVPGGGGQMVSGEVSANPGHGAIAHRVFRPKLSGFWYF